MSDLTASGTPLQRGSVLRRALYVLFLLGPAAHAAGNPVAGGTLTMGLATDTAIIDPSITGSSITALITRNVVDSLVGQAEDGRFTPWLAERWEVSADNTAYTFHLRQGVTFSDGTTLDAAAVRYNLNRILDPKTTSSYAKSLLGPVAGIEAPDERTVTLTYRQPFAPLLQGLSLPYLGIQSPVYLGKATSTTNTVVGSGPFVLDQFVKGSGSRLSRRADYKWGPGYAAHGGAAYLDAIVFKYLPESSVRAGALGSGQLQAIDEVPPSSFRTIQADQRLSVITRENPGGNRAFPQHREGSVPGRQRPPCLPERGRCRRRGQARLLRQPQAGRQHPRPVDAALRSRDRHALGLRPRPRQPPPGRGRVEGRVGRRSQRGWAAAHRAVPL